jgi:hypothetical protein
MVGTWSMTGFTRHARNQVSLVEASADARTRCVAAETPHHFPVGNWTIHRFFNARWREQSARRREVDRSKLLEIGDPGFKKISTLFLK